MWVIITILVFVFHCFAFIKIHLYTKNTLDEYYLVEVQKLMHI